MQTIRQFSLELGLNEDQTKKLEEYMSQMVMELLVSIKEDNDKNFDETINNIKA